MAFGYVLFSEVTYGGLYFTEDFTISGPQPTWEKITVTGLPNLLCTWLAVDPFNPRNRQYIRVANGIGEIYTRNGGAWTKVLDDTICKAALGLGGAGTELTSPWCDPTIDGKIIALYSYDVDNKYVMISTDYGSTWTGFQFYGGQGSNGETKSIGNNYWRMLDGNIGLPAPAVNYTPDTGVTKKFTTNLKAGATTAPPCLIDPNNPTTIAYTYYDNAGSEDLVSIDLASASPMTLTILQTGIAQHWLTHRDGAWIDPSDSTHMRLFSTKGGLGTASIFATTDSWATLVNNAPTAMTVAGASAMTHIQNSGSMDEVIFGDFTSGGTKIFASDSETDYTPTARDGDNAGAPPYTNSVPRSGVLAYYGIWVGNAPSNTGVFVFSVEMEPGDNTWDDSIISYDALGSPMGGDRSSFRDMYADGFDVYHAEDVHADTPQIHAPWPADSGEAPVSDGTKYVPTDIITQAEFDYSFYVGFHAPVTLDADAALILDLQSATGQEIGLDTQQPTYVWMGPSFAPANEPTFQPMYIEQLANVVTTAPIGDGEVLTFDETIGQWINADSEPALSDLHNHIINEDHTDETDGAEVNFSTSLEFRTGSTAVYLNGLRQRLDTHYTEDVDRLGVTFVTAPEDDDELIIDYIVEYTEYVSTLLDSEDVELQDSESMLIGDSEV